MKDNGMSERELFEAIDHVHRTTKQPQETRIQVLTAIAICVVILGAFLLVVFCDGCSSRPHALLPTSPKIADAKTITMIRTQREIWAEKYPDVRRVLQLDPNISLIHYDNS